MKKKNNIKKFGNLILIILFLSSTTLCDSISEFKTYDITTKNVRIESLNNYSIIFVSDSNNNGFLYSIPHTSFQLENITQTDYQTSHSLGQNYSKSIQICSFPNKNDKISIVDFDNKSIIIQIFNINQTDNTFVKNEAWNFDISNGFLSVILLKNGYFIFWNDNQFIKINGDETQQTESTHTLYPFNKFIAQDSVSSIDCKEIVDNMLICFFSNSNNNILYSFGFNAENGEKIYQQMEFLSNQRLSTIIAIYVHKLNNNNSNLFYICIQDASSFVCTVGQFDSEKKVIQQKSKKLFTVSDCTLDKILIKEKEGFLFTSFIIEQNITVSRITYDIDKDEYTHSPQTISLNKAINDIDFTLHDKYTMTLFISTKDNLQFSFYVYTPKCEDFSVEAYYIESKTFNLNDIYKMNTIKSYNELTIQFKSFPTKGIIVNNDQEKLDKLKSYSITKEFSYLKEQKSNGEFVSKYVIGNSDIECSLTFKVKSNTISCQDEEYNFYYNIIENTCQDELSEYTYVNNEDTEHILRKCKYNCDNSLNNNEEKIKFCKDTVRNKCFGSSIISLSKDGKNPLVLDTNPLDEDPYYNFYIDFLQEDSLESKKKILEKIKNGIEEGNDLIKIMNYICSFYQIVYLAREREKVEFQSTFQKYHNEICDILQKKIIAVSYNELNEENIKYNMLFGLTLYHFLVNLELETAQKQLTDISSFESVLISYGIEYLTNADNTYRYIQKDYATILIAISSLLLKRYTPSSEKQEDVSLITDELTKEIKSNIDKISELLSKFNMKKEKEEKSNHYFNMNTDMVTLISYPLSALDSESTSQNGVIISMRECNDKDQLHKETQVLKFNLKICVPYNELLAEYSDSQYISVIYYSNSFPLISSLDLKKISKSFSSLSLRDKNNKIVNIDNTESTFKFIYKRELQTFNECLFIDVKTNKLNNTNCTSEELNENYIICQCNHLTEFSISNFNPNPSNQPLFPNETENIQPRFINSFAAFENLNGQNAVALYIILTFFIILLIGLVFTLRYDILFEKDCFVNVDNINITSNCTYSEDVLIEINCAEIEINKQTQLINSKKEIELVNIDPTGNNITTVNNEVLSSRLNKSLIQKTKSNSCCNFFQGVLKRFFLKQYFVCFLFFNTPSDNNPSNIIKTNYLICFLSRMIVIMFVCSLFAECDTIAKIDQMNLININDITVAIISILIVEIPYVFLKLLLNKTRISSCTKNSMLRYRVSTICRHIMIYLIIVGFISFCGINTQWILIDSENNGLKCRLIVDFCIGIFGDIIIFQILILIFKSFIFVLMIKCGDTCVIGSVLKCFLTTIPFLFSLEE